MPVIAYNGAFIFETSGKILSSNIFSEEEKQIVANFLNARGISPLVYAFIDEKEKVSWMQGKENEGMLRYLSLRPGDRRLTPLADIDCLYRGNAFYFTCIGEKDELWPIYDRFKDDSHYNCIIQQELYRNWTYPEIQPKLIEEAERRNFY